MICRIDGKSIKFMSRNHHDWTSRLTPLVRAAADLDLKTAIFDGEVVVVKSDGTTDFQALQNAFREGNTAEFQYYAFDLLYLNGQSLVDLPLEQRKAALAELLTALPANSPIHYSEHFSGTGKAFQKQACKLHLEGSISKRRDRPYRPGRGYDWLKVKCGHNEEFVIGGFTDPSGSRKGFGALLMGYYDRNHRLHYAGKVGTGFGAKVLRDLHPRLQALEQNSSPFVDRSSKTGPSRNAHWVSPKLVAQISYGSRTREGILRHAAFEGLREDKSPTEVELDEVIQVANAVKKSGPANRSARKSSKWKSPPKKKTSLATLDDPNAQMIGGVRLTSPDKILYPGTAITKRELALYYQDVAPWMLPHIAHRPLVLVRCPEGQGKECFYQKHPGVGTPDELRRIPIRESSKTEEYVVVDDVPGLIALAQVGALEIHAWGSREDKLESPDRLIFDLDPGPEVAWKVVVDSAKQIRDFLQELGLETFVKTTGGKGLHLVAPISRRQKWDEAKAFCKAIATLLADTAPDVFMATMSKAARTHKIFVDYLRNGRGATAVIPFSPRAMPNAPVSTPLTWQELSPKVAADHYTIANIRRRLSSLAKDPWAGFAELRQSLTGPIQKLRSLRGFYKP
jgi:bifunctional non-homologous end joining protein LigD